MLMCKILSHRGIRAKNKYAEVIYFCKVSSVLRRVELDLRRVDTESNSFIGLPALLNLIAMKLNCLLRRYPAIEH